MLNFGAPVDFRVGQRLRNLDANIGFLWSLMV